MMYMYMHNYTKEEELIVRSTCIMYLYEYQGYFSERHVLIL